MATIRCWKAASSSRFAIRNGFPGIRGARAASRGARWVVPARTCVAGLFDVSGTDHHTPGQVTAAHWLRVRFLVAGEPLLLHPGDVSSHRMTLDLRRGTLLSQGSRVKAPVLGLHARTLRLVSLSDRAIELQLIQLEVESGTIDVTMASEPSLQIDGRAYPPARREMGRCCQRGSGAASSATPLVWNQHDATALYRPARRNRVVPVRPAHWPDRPSPDCARRG